MDHFEQYKRQLEKLAKEISSETRLVPGFRNAFIEELTAYNQLEIKGNRYLEFSRLIKEIKAELQIIDANMMIHKDNALIKTVLYSYRNKLKVALVQINELIMQKIQTPKDLHKRYSYFSALFESCKGINVEIILHPEKISKKLP